MNPKPMKGETATKPPIKETEQNTMTIFVYSPALVEATRPDRPTGFDPEVESYPSAMIAILQQSGVDTNQFSALEQWELFKIEQILCKLEDQIDFVPNNAFTGFGAHIRIRGGLALNVATESNLVGLSSESIGEIRNRRARMQELSQKGYFYGKLSLASKNPSQQRILALTDDLLNKILGKSLDLDVRAEMPLPPQQSLPKGSILRQTSSGPQIAFITPGKPPKNDSVISPGWFIELLSEKDQLVDWRSDLEACSLGCNPQGFINIDHLPPRKNGRYQMAFNEDSANFYQDQGIRGELLRARYRAKSLSYAVINYAEISGEVNKCSTINSLVEQVIGSGSREGARPLNRVLIEMFKSYHVSPQDFLVNGKKLGLLGEECEVQDGEEFPQFLKRTLGTHAFQQMLLFTLQNDGSIFGQYLAEVGEEIEFIETAMSGKDL